MYPDLYPNLYPDLESCFKEFFTIGLYRKNAIGIESEATDRNGGIVCLFSAATCTSQCNLRSCRRAFARKERNLDCDEHVTAEK